jgi:GTP-binding protein
MADPQESMAPLFDLIVRHVPPPKAHERVEEPFTLLATIIEYDNFLGRILTGRIESGRARQNAPIKALTRTGELLEQGRIAKILVFRGLERVAIEEAEAGDIVAIAGLEQPTVADTLCDLSVDKPIPATPIDPPTLSVTFSVNDSPLAGREGSKVQCGHPGQRKRRSRRL